MRSDPTLRKWYKTINRRFFENSLPDNVCVRWANPDEEKDARWEEKYFAEAREISSAYHCYEIVLSRPLNPRLSGKLSSLAHEMIHIKTSIRDDHGPAFEKWRRHISDRGIFKKHALVKNLTIF